jgi:serine/threonine protein phosphatase PrpC
MSPVADTAGGRLVFASISDVGRSRKNNEDTIGDPAILARVVGRAERLRSRGALFAVADGMGGHSRGELASHLAVATLFAAYYKSSGEHAPALLAAWDAAHASVFLAGGAANADLEKTSPLRMGTTLVAALALDGQLLVANVGDSRGYVLASGTLSQVTTDHSLVAEEIRLGMLNADEAKHAPFKNVLTRALGAEKESHAELFEVAWSRGDAFLLCSDGLHGVVDESRMAQMLAELAPEEAARGLVSLANEAGGPDNVSVVVGRLD